MSRQKRIVIETSVWSLRSVAFGLRHLIVVAASAAFLSICFLVPYLLLFLYAVISGGDLGSPLTLPIGLILIATITILIGVGIFMPASYAGMLVCKIMNWPRLAAIPITFLTGYLLLYLYTALYEVLYVNGTLPHITEPLLLYIVVFSIPLGIHWWLAEGPSALLDTVIRLYKRWHSRRVEKLLAG